MAKRIKGLTDNYEEDLQTTVNGLMLRYLNKDYSYDVISMINKKMVNLLKKGNQKKSIATLTYWKYRFLMLKSIQKDDQNYKEAISYLKKAYWLGSADAAAEYGFFYYTGTGIADGINKAKAKRCFDKAVKGDALFLEYMVGKSLLYKENNEEKIAKAIPYYEEALQKNVLECKYELATLYMKLNTNLDRAEELLTSLNTYNAKDRLEELRKMKIADKKKRP